MKTWMTPYRMNRNTECTLGLPEITNAHVDKGTHIHKAMLHEPNKCRLL